MMPGAAPVLELNSIEVRYGQTLVVSDVSFAVEQGEFVTLLGPSGSGKTSLLRVIAGFVVPVSGEVKLRGARVDHVPPFRRDIGMVFQNYALFPHMTVAENLGFGLRMLGEKKSEISARVDESLSHVRLNHLHDRYPHEISGGQQQRVAIARALVIRPSLLLMDEPMSNLDARLRAEMRTDLIDLLKGLGVTTVSVTHNQEEALAMSDRIIVMANGHIRQIGSPSEVYTKPSDQFVADFIGDTNIISGDPISTKDGLTQYDTKCGQPIYATANANAPTAASLLLIRPEAIEVAPGETCRGANQMLGSICSRVYMGAFIEIRVAVGAHEFLVKKPAGPNYDNLSVGNTVIIQWEPSAVAVLRHPREG